MILNKIKYSNPVGAGILIVLYASIQALYYFKGNPPVFFEFGIFYHFQEFILQLNPVLTQTINIGVTIISALVLNSIINKSTFFDKNTLLPFGLYLLLMSTTQNFNGLNPITLSNLMLILYLKWAFKIKKQDDARELIFNASFILATATLIFPLYSPFILSPFLLLVVFRPFIWREWAMAGLGLLIPALFYAFLIYFLDFNFEENTYNLSFWHIADLSFTPSIQHITVLAIAMILALLSFITISRQSSRSSLRLRLMIRFLTFNFIALLILSTVLFYRTESYLLLLSIPLSIMLSYFFYHTSKFVGNLLLTVFLMSIYYLTYFS